MLHSGKRVRDPKVLEESASDDDDHDESPKKKSKVYDDETGALCRMYRSFASSKINVDRGYGRTEALHDHPFLHPQIILIVGPTGCGKTTLMLNILEEFLEHIADDRMGDVIVYSGSPKDELLRVLDDDEVEFFGPEQTQSLLDRLDQMQVDGIESGMMFGGMGKKEEGGRDITDKTSTGGGSGGGGGRGHTSGHKKKKLHFMVLDDVGNNKDLCPNNAKGTSIGRTLQSHRHIPMCIIMLVQKWKMLPTFARANMAHLFLFPGQSESERKEILQNVPFPKEQIENLMRLTGTKRHQFMWIDFVRKTAKLGFDRVLLE